MLVMTEFTDVQRERIVRDIINHELNAAANSNDRHSDAEVNELVAETRALDDDELERVWYGQVGEWLCSIGSEYPSFYDAWQAVESEYDNPADWQFEVLLDDGDIDYQYNVEYMYETPYTDVTG